MGVVQVTGNSPTNAFLDHLMNLISGIVDLVPSTTKYYIALVLEDGTEIELQADVEASNPANGQFIAEAYWENTTGSAVHITGVRLKYELESGARETWFENSVDRYVNDGDSITVRYTISFVVNPAGTLGTRIVEWMIGQVTQDKIVRKIAIVTTDGQVITLDTNVTGGAGSLEVIAEATWIPAETVAGSPGYALTQSDVSSGSLSVELPDDVVFGRGVEHTIRVTITVQVQ